MRVGFSLPQYGKPGQEADGVVRFARAAQEAGASGLWVGDRLFSPDDYTVPYPGYDGFPPEFDVAVDPFVALAMAAAVTDDLLLGSSTINAPFYPAAAFARQAASLDLAAGGRLRLGLGIGWSPEEYRALGVPMAQRGARLDECLDVLDAWFATPVRHAGRFADVGPATVRARRDARPPVLLAGFAPAAQRRIATRADGWLPVSMVGALPAAASAAPLAAIRGLAAEAGREPSDIGVHLRINVPAGTPVGKIVDAVLEGRDALADGGEFGSFVELGYLGDDVDSLIGLMQEISAAVADR